MRGSSSSSRPSSTPGCRPGSATPPITTRRRGASPAWPRPSGASTGTPRRWTTWRSSCCAPQARLDDGIFEWDLALDAIRRKVRRRVEDYAGERDHWFRDWFEPTWRRLEVRSLSWEDLIDAIAFHSLEDGHVIDSFYGQCLRFNRPQAGRALPRAPLPVRPRAEVAHRAPSARVVGRLLEAGCDQHPDRIAAEWSAGQGVSSRGQPLDEPAAVGAAGIQQPVVQAVGPALPELDRVGDHAIAAPVGRPGDRPSGYRDSTSA